MRILGLVAKTHDSGLALLNDGIPELILEEERFNRIKHTHKFPSRSLAAAFDERGLDLDSVDAVTTPWDVVQLRRTFAHAVGRRFPLSLALLRQKSHRPQRNRIVVLNQILTSELRRHFRTRAVPPIVNVAHHDSHAAVFFASPFEEAIVLVMDGYGDVSSASAYIGRGNRLERIWSTNVFNSLGLVYTFVTEHLGFEGFGDEGKVMALAAYGSDEYVSRFRDVVRLTPDGGYAVNMDYFDYDAFGQLRPFKRSFLDTFGPPRARNAAIEDRHRDLARALQVVTEDVVLHIVRHLTRETGLTNLCMTGGVALNCVANARILDDTDVTRIWVPPCASDTGAPLGSALWHHHQTLGNPRCFEMTHPYYGKSYTEAEIQSALKAAGLSSRRMAPSDLTSRTARALADGKVVAWMQGPFEIGPRALGNRSILADPRRAEMRDILNARVKKREPFRPFAPAVLAERAHEFFDISQPDPFMTLAPRVHADKRDLIPAAVHIDGTARIQTIDRDANPAYHGLIEEFGRITGVPILLNTSFNRQEPIVASPADAIACFLRTEIDILVMGDFFIDERCAHAVQRARHNATTPNPRRTEAAVVF